MSKVKNLVVIKDYLSLIKKKKQFHKLRIIVFIISVIGAGTTIKAKQHQALDKAYSEFLKLEELFEKTLDASDAAKSELKSYFDLCQKRKQISILYQNEDGEMSLSRISF